MTPFFMADFFYQTGRVTSHFFILTKNPGKGDTKPGFRTKKCHIVLGFVRGCISSDGRAYRKSVRAVVLHVDKVAGSTPACAPDCLTINRRERTRHNRHNLSWISRLVQMERIGVS